MKRNQYHNYGGPELMRLEEFDLSRPGKGQVAVKVKFAAIHPNDWKLRNVSFSGNGSPSASVIYGYDQQRRIRNIVVDNVTVGGKRITGPETNVLEIGPHVDGLTYK